MLVSTCKQNGIQLKIVGFDSEKLSAVPYKADTITRGTLILLQDQTI